MYGYRYSPTSPPFPLPGLSLADATAEVERRRTRQSVNNNPATVELVCSTADGWHLVLQTPTPSYPQQAATLPAAEDPVGAVLADLATLPRRTGRKRRHR